MDQMTRATVARAEIDIEALKSRHVLSAIVGRRVKLRRAGHELVGLCPFHKENTPSFRVNDTKGVFNCFGCSAHGDVLDFIMETEGLHFMSAVRWLEGSADLPPADPAAREREERIEREARAAAIVQAQAQWRAARSIVGTPAELYLRSRGITEPVPPSIRFGRVPLWRNKKTGADGRLFPALIGACQDVHGKVVGVQRVFLTEDGRKAPIKNPKLSLGKVRGCALRLGPPAREVRLCEGPEDGLSIRQKHPGPPVWVSLGTGALPNIELPDEVEDVTIMGDNNAPGRACVAAGIEAFEVQKRAVRGDYPPVEFEDWNDELMGKRVA